MHLFHIYLRYNCIYLLFPAVARELSLLDIIYTETGAYVDIYLLDTRESFPGGKATVS